MEEMKKEQMEHSDYEENYAKAFECPKQWPLTIADMLSEEDGYGNY